MNKVLIFFFLLFVIMQISAQTDTRLHYKEITLLDVNIEKVERDDGYQVIYVSYEIAGINKDKSVGRILSYQIDHIVKVKSDSSAYSVNIGAFAHLNSLKSSWREKKDFKSFSFKRKSDKLLLYDSDTLKMRRPHKIIFRCEDKVLELELPEPENNKN